MYCSVCKKEVGDGGFCRYCGNRLTAETAAHHLKPGTVLGGKYVIQDFIGEGGFGITYIGRDRNLDIPVAIKEYYPCGFAGRSGGDSNAVSITAPDKRDFFENGKKRFMEEARSLARFSEEPGIVNVRDYFEENETAYIAMEYLEGENLNAHVSKRGRMDAAELIQLMEPVMRSLERIHEAGIIHRDISPDNILFQKNGKLKLMDFGSARYFANSESELSVILKQGFSPEEQYRKKGEQGPWTDVYSLCATIYCCITGKIPENALDRLHNDALLPPSRLDARISPAHERALMRGLEVLPENRCRTMGELKSLFDAGNVSTAGGRGASDPYKTHMAEERDLPPAQPVPPKPRNKRMAVAAALCVCVLLAAATLAATLPKLLKNETKTEGSEAKTKSEKAVKTAAVEKADTGKKKAAAAKKSEEMISVPDVVGLRSDEAKARLAGAGLIVSEIQAESSSVETDYVISQSPVGDKKAKSEDTVTIYVSAANPADAQPRADQMKTETLQPNPASKVLYCRASEFATLRASASTGAAELAKVSSRQAVQLLDETGEFYYVAYNGQNGYVLKDFFSEDPNAALNYSGSAPAQPSTVTYYCRASISATLRSIASRDGADLAQIGSGEEVQCLGESGEFYNVIYKGQNGYVLKDFFSQDPNAPLNYGSGNASSAAGPEAAVYYCCASESATLRSVASRDGAALAQVASREAVECIGSSGDFYYVSYQGKTGYVLKNYFSTDPNAELNYGKN